MRDSGNPKLAGFFTRRSPVWLLLVTGLIAVSTGYPQAGRRIDGYVQLIRPSVNSDRPLFRFILKVKDEAGTSVEIPSQGDLKTQLTIKQTIPEEKTYRPYYAIASGKGQAVTPPRYALVVFDVSGSMGENMGFKTKFDAAKNAAQKILGQFDPSVDRIAIVPFESHNVSSGIRRARFVGDLKVINGQLQELPIPKSGNTGLFSAVLAGLEVLGSQDSRAMRILIVMTDGQNDVRKDKGDESDLIEGSVVPQSIIDKIREKQLPVYTIGFGGSTAINEPAMRSLAWPDRSNYIPAQDEKELERAFKRIRSELINSIQGVIAPDEKSFSELSGADRVFRVGLRTLSGEEIKDTEGSFRYSPSMTGSPTTSIMASEEELAAYLAIGKEQDVRAGMPPYVPFLIYAALIAVLWFVVPRFVWPEYAAPERGYSAPKAAPGSAGRGPVPRQASATGWRTQTGQTGTTAGGRLGGSAKTNVGPGIPPEQR
jgi:Mg-chelatase subunit ChlD